MTNPDPLRALLDPTAATNRAITFAAGQVRFAITTALSRDLPRDAIFDALQRAFDALHVAESLSRDAQ